MKELMEIIDEVHCGKYQFYVYVLYKPDLTPFYVGKARVGKKSQRVEWHEYEANLKEPPKSRPYWNAFKVNTIRKIWREGGKVLYAIDSWHEEEKQAYDREKQLIAEYGRRIVGEGTLTNITEGGEKEMAGIPEETRLQISNSLKQYFSDPKNVQANSERITKYFEENPEARELARQNAIKTGAGDKLVEWMETHPEEVAKRRIQQGKSLKQYYVENPDEAQALADRRNEVLRSEEHRQKMAERTRNYIKNNPEANQKRRDKACESLRKTYEEKTLIRRECLGIMRERLLAAGEIYANTKVSNKALCRWQKRGLVNKYFPGFPAGNVSAETWRNFREEINEGQRSNLQTGTV